MTTRRTLTACGAATIVFSLAPLHAASDAWDGSINATWATGTNWALDPAVAPGAGDTATFNNAGNGFTTIDLGTGVTIGAVQFDTAGAAAYTIGSGAVGTQTLALGTAVTVNSTVAANQLFNANLGLATTGLYTVTNASTTHGLTFAGGISATSAGIKQLRVAGAGNTAISGAITSGTGTMNLSKTGTGQLTLSGGGDFNGNGTDFGNATGPFVLWEGTTRITAGTYNVTGEGVLGGIFNDVNGGAGTNVNLTMDGGILNVSAFFSVARGNGVGAVSSDLVLNNSAAVNAANLGMGFNNGNVANLPKGSLAMNQTSTFSITGANRGVNIAENAGSTAAVTMNDGSVFNAGDSQVRIGQGGTGSLTLNGTSRFNHAATNRLLTVGTNAGGSGTVTMNGSSTFTHTANITSVGEGGTGVFNIASNTATANVRNLVIGRLANGVGAVYNKGTVLGINADGIFMGDGATSVSYFRNDNAAATVANATAANINVAIGLNSNSVADVVGGALSGTTVRLGVGNNTNANNAQLNVSGGQFTAGANGIRVAENSNKWGNVNVTGGTLTSTGPINLGLGDAATNTGILSVKTGGTVVADTITATGTLSSALVNFDGGTLQAAGATAALVSANVDRVTVATGGLTVDTAGVNKSIDAVIASPDANGTTTFGVTSISLSGTGTGYEGRPLVKITGDGSGATAVADFNPATGEVTGVTVTNPGSGYTVAPTVSILGGGGTALTATPALGSVAGGGLTKTGNGTLTLKATNTFTGPITVNGGTLAYGEAQSQAITVANGGALTVTPAFGTIGTLTIPALTLQAGSTVDLELSPGGFNDEIEVTTAGTGLNLGTASVRLYEDGTTNPFQTLGTYTLFKYSGGFTGSASNLSVANPVLGFTYTFAATGSEITVTIGSSDSDNDGLPNAWEVANGLNPNDPNGVNGPDGNLDGDFANNLQEFQAGTAANDADDDPLDLDNDGLLDTWETTYFANIAARDGTGDHDGDLATDLAEFVAETTPTSADPLFPGDWPDSDGDNMNDAWEVKYFGTITAKDGTVDSDSDGAFDLAEFQALSSPVDAAWTPEKSKLIHRWSFNGSLADSVPSATGPDAHTNSPATIEDPNGVDASSTVTLSATDALLAGGARATSDYVSLGSNLLAGRATPATIEVWASQVSIQNWARIFDFGSGETENLFMSWSNGGNASATRTEFRDYVGSTADAANLPYVLNTEYHIVFIFEPGKGDFGGNRVTCHVAPTIAGDLGSFRSTFSTTNNLANFADTVATLGRSSYAGDNTANARYNDVRIWLGNLPEGQREKLHDLGADSNDLTDTDGDGLLDSWETAWFGSATGASASGDPDGDGFDNLAEQAGRSIPTLPGGLTSVPDDRDGDGLLDAWEVTHFTSLDQAGSGDPDGDLATNEQEESAGSNPNNAASWPDTDGDLIKDAWELLHFGDLDIDDDADNANDGAADFDSDGFTDKQEFDAGSNPKLASSVAPAVVILPATGTDAASDIASTKTYTHAIDFGATTAAVAVNGVSFHQASVPALGNDGSNNDRWDSTDNTGGRSGPFRMDKSVANDWPQNNNNPGNVGSDGNMAAILTDFSHINGSVVGSTQTITLGGLTAGTRYSTRIYYRTWALAGNRSTTFTFNGDGSNVVTTFNCDQSATPESGYVKYDFTANDSDVTIVFAVNTAGNSWHQYALTNEVVPAGDADNDTLPDAWETTHFGNTTSQGAAGDPDNDGTENRAEYLLGLSPVDGSQRFKATQSGVVPGTGVTLTWPAQDGLTFTVWRSTTLAGWTQLGGTVTASGTSASYTDTTAPLGKAFYRIILTTP